MINFSDLFRSNNVAISIDLLTKIFAFAKDAIEKVVGLTTENASLKEQLATAMASDAADQGAIATAKAEAEAAKVEAEAAKAALAPLQAAIAADATEDEQVNALINSVKLPEPVVAPVVEPVVKPVVEPVV